MYILGKCFVKEVEELVILTWDLGHSFFLGGLGLYGILDHVHGESVYLHSFSFRSQYHRYQRDHRYPNFGVGELFGNRVEIPSAITALGLAEVEWDAL